MTDQYPPPPIRPPDMPLQPSHPQPLSKPVKTGYADEEEENKRRLAQIDVGIIFVKILISIAILNVLRTLFPLFF